MPSEDRQHESIVAEDELSSLPAEELRKLDVGQRLVEALLYEKLANGRVRCRICQRYCRIPDGKLGYCKTKLNLGGTLYTTIYGVVSAAHADPIEKKPVFHYKPGSLVYSLGSFGCNFRCLFCQNWEIAYADGVAAGGLCEPNLTPNQAIQIARESGCAGIAWTYNEPAIWLNYALDCARLAKQEGLYTVYVTNGYATPEGLDAIGPYLDVYRVDVKSFADDFYRRLIRVPQAQGIRDVARRARERWHMHVECVTNVIPGWNDDEQNLRRIAAWIHDSLGRGTPWHITRFFPYAQLTDVPPTPIATLQRAVQIGKEEGLAFVYLGNVATTSGANTYCPTDGRLLIRRSGYHTEVVGLDAVGRCAYDGTELGMIV